MVPHALSLGQHLGLEGMQLLRLRPPARVNEAAREPRTTRKDCLVHTFSEGNTKRCLRLGAHFVEQTQSDLVRLTPHCKSCKDFHAVSSEGVTKYRVASGRRNGRCFCASQDSIFPIKMLRSEWSNISSHCTIYPQSQWASSCILACYPHCVCPGNTKSLTMSIRFQGKAFCKRPFDERDVQNGLS